MAKKKYRVLRELEIDGKKYKPDGVLVIDEKLGSTYEQAGALDGDKAASGYAEKVLGAEAVVHGDEAAEEPTKP